MTYRWLEAATALRDAIDRTLAGLFGRRDSLGRLWWRGGFYSD